MFAVPNTVTNSQYWVDNYGSCSTSLQACTIPRLHKIGGGSVCPASQYEKENVFCKALRWSGKQDTSNQVKDKHCLWQLSKENARTGFQGLLQMWDFTAVWWMWVRTSYTLKVTKCSGCHDQTHGFNLPAVVWWQCHRVQRLSVLRKHPCIYAQASCNLPSRIS